LKAICATPGPADDSVGGNMTAAQTLLAKERSGPHIGARVLFYPVTDASLDTDSYHQFAEGYFLRRDGMCDHRRG
jgi:acetyl esterase